MLLGGSLLLPSWIPQDGELLDLELPKEALRNIRLTSAGQLVQLVA